MNDPFKTYSFYTPMTVIQDKFDITINEDEYENLAIYAWNAIGNKNTRIYKYNATVEDYTVTLPANAEIVESVHSDIEDYQMTENTLRENYSNNIIESYIESRKRGKSGLYTGGRLIPYSQEGDCLRFQLSGVPVTIVYKGILVGEDDEMPMLNFKEVEALSNYVAFIKTQKQGYINRDQLMIQMAAQLKADWRRSADAARSPIYLNQNAMDEILNIRGRLDRKRFNVSYKPII